MPESYSHTLIEFLMICGQAYQMRPSIIFFDEIDGLAPVRSSRQDQIHRSAKLLTLYCSCMMTKMAICKVYNG